MTIPFRVLTSLLASPFLFVGGGAAAVYAQGTVPDCSVSVARLDSQPPTVAAIQAVRRCRRDGPGALAATWRRPVPADVQDVLADVSGSLPDQRLLVALMSVAADSVMSTDQRLAAMAALTRYVLPHSAPTVSFLRAAVGDPLPYRDHVSITAGAEPLVPSDIASSRQTFTRLANADPNSLVRRAGRMLANQSRHLLPDSAR